jgi:alanyl-tRNA synthetase
MVKKMSGNEIRQTFIDFSEDAHVEALLQKHVDTGMGFENIILAVQEVDYRHKTDSFPNPAMCCGLRFPIQGFFVSNLGYELT